MRKKILMLALVGLLTGSSIGTYNMSVRAAETASTVTSSAITSSDADSTASSDSMASSSATVSKPKKESKTPKILSVEKIPGVKKARRITWSSVSNVKTYQIKVCVNKSFAKKYKPTTLKLEDNVVDLTNMKKKNNYYFKVRAILDNGKTTKWSKVKKISLK